VASKPPPEPNVSEVETLARGIGILVTSLDPSPALGTLLATYGTLFSGLCKQLEADPMRMLQYLDERYEITMLSKEEFKAQLQKEGN